MEGRRGQALTEALLQDVADQVVAVRGGDHDRHLDRDFPSGVDAVEGGYARPQGEGLDVEVAIVQEQDERSAVGVGAQAPGDRISGRPRHVDLVRVLGVAGEGQVRNLAVAQTGRGGTVPVVVVEQVAGCEAAAAQDQRKAGLAGCPRGNGTNTARRGRAYRCLARGVLHKNGRGGIRVFRCLYPAWRQRHDTVFYTRWAIVGLLLAAVVLFARPPVPAGAQEGSWLSLSDLVERLGILTKRVDQLEAGRGNGLTSEGRCGLGIHQMLRDETVLDYKNTYAECPQMDRLVIRFVEFDPETEVLVIIYEDWFNNRWVNEQWQGCEFREASDWWEDFDARR